MITALCGQKGGSGKTTAAIAITGELLARGARVLLVDADTQGSARTWGDVAAEHGHPAPTIVVMGSTMHLPGQLDAIAPHYDHVLIDCPPRLDDVQRSALMVADLAVMPCGPSAVDAWAMAASVQVVQRAQSVRPELRVVALITRKIAHTVIGAGARDALAQTGLRVLGAELHARVAYQEAPAFGLGIAQHAPRDPAAAEVRALVDELLREGITHVQAEATDRTTATRRAELVRSRGSGAAGTCAPGYPGT